jgi:tetratricopeptide (TPR) repeat protein
LDPRSALTARRLAHTLLRLRRFPEALAAADRGLAVSPDNLDLLENKAMIYLAQGDLEGARGVIFGAPPEVEPTALVAFFANYWDLFWALDDSRQRLLLRLPLSAFDGDRGAWGIVRAQTHHIRGDAALARIYADSARLGFEETLADNPDNPQRRILLGLALAYLGEKTRAVDEGERGFALLPPAGDGYTGPYLKHQLARIYILAGEQDKALNQLEALLRMPYYVSPGWLRIDPTFDPLRKNPRFQKLVEGTGSVEGTP